MSDYSDIINIPYHKSKNRQQISIQDRAAQFAPFAALTGHDSAINETARITDAKIEIDDEIKLSISEKLKFLIDNLDRKFTVEIIYFIKDKNKKGGAYLTIVDCIKKIDEINGTVITDGLNKIIIDDIYDIKIKEMENIYGIESW